MFRLLLILTLVSSACNRREPVACFVLPGQPMKTEVKYEFDNCSDNAASYLWDFDDGGSSERPVPLYTYTKPGIYDISLTASNKSKSDILRRRINVLLTDHTKRSSGIYRGEYKEYYPDSFKLDTSYPGTLQVTALNPDSIAVDFRFGNFACAVAGKEPDYSFTKFNHFESVRLDSAWNEKGFYEDSLRQFSFSVEGKDLETGGLKWIIEFNGFLR